MLELFALGAVVIAAGGGAFIGLYTSTTPFFLR
jgi:hypothetical protein